VGACYGIPTEVNQRTQTWSPYENSDGENRLGVNIWDACATVCTPRQENGILPGKQVCKKQCLEQYNIDVGMAFGAAFRRSIGVQRYRRNPWKFTGAVLVECKLSKIMALYKCTNKKDSRGVACAPGQSFNGITQKASTCSSVNQEKKYGRKGISVSHGGFTGCEAMGRHPTIRKFYKCQAENEKSVTKEEAEKCSHNLCSNLAAIY
jgi:hypothetical protein